MTHNPDNDAREQERYALDAIATLLGTAKRWNVEDLETIADIIGKVRPHPGSGAPARSYTGVFSSAMGRDVPKAYNRTPPEYAQTCDDCGAEPGEPCRIDCLNDAR